MNLGQIRNLARTLLSEPSAAYWSDLELNLYINEGLSDFCTKTDILEDISTYSSVLAQGDYALPSNYTKVKSVEFVKGSSVYFLQPIDIYEFYQGFVRQSSSPPNNYNLWEGNVRLSERPSIDAPSTTLNGGITAAANTLTLTSSAALPQTGRIIIDSEVIEYWSNTNNILTPLTRGKEGSTAAVHNNLATVTFRDIWVYHHIVDNTLTLDTDTPTIPVQFHNDIAFYCAYIGRFKSKDYDLANQFKGQYDQAVMDGMMYVKAKWKRHRSPK